MRKKRTPDQVRRDRETIAKLYLQRKTQAQIAEIISKQYDFDVSQQQISYDLGEIRKDWKLASIAAIDHAKVEALQELNLMIAETWTAWEESKNSRKVIFRKSGEIATRIETQVGNPAYMNLLGVQWDRKCKILGIEAESKYEDINLAITAVIRAGFVVQNPTIDVQFQPTIPALDRN
ncbi:hypothetical protein [Phormidesmis sp. 146-33]